MTELSGSTEVDAGEDGMGWDDMNRRDRLIRAAIIPIGLTVSVLLIWLLSLVPMG